MKLNLVVLGLSVTSSWGNGHATTFRALLRALNRRGHTITFLERDVPWYAAQRDMPDPEFCQVHLYDSVDELRDMHTQTVADADLVILGSYVPQGIEVAEWMLTVAKGVTAFYDIDTPVTLARIARGDCEYLAPQHIPRFDYYFSFTGGPVLKRLETQFGSPRARALYCSVDPDLYFPRKVKRAWDLGYLGTYSPDRQPGLKRLLLNIASGGGSFIVAGPQYPEDVVWPPNVDRIEHLPPTKHRAFYNRQRFTLNLTRKDMIGAGYSPSVRLFEAAACGVPIISDWWEGLDRFFKPGREIFVARTSLDVMSALWDCPRDEACEVGTAARERVLREHTCDHRAYQIEECMGAMAGAGS